jgi:hypothetical protein
MEIKLYTTTKELGKRRIEVIVRESIAWCKENLGINRRRKEEINYLLYSQEKSQDGTRNLGCYDPSFNTIGVSYNLNKNVRELINTIIHEYQHSLQPISYYRKYDKQYGYYNNPLEVEARMVAEKNYFLLWEEIQENLENILTKKKKSTNIVRHFGEL